MLVYAKTMTQVSQINDRFESPNNCIYDPMATKQMLGLSCSCVKEKSAKKADHVGRWSTEVMHLPRKCPIRTLGNYIKSNV